MSDALKSNTTLTQLRLGREDKKKQHTNAIHQQFSLSLFLPNQQATRLETQEQHH